MAGFLGFAHDIDDPKTEQQEMSPISMQIELNRLSAVKARDKKAQYTLDVFVRKNNSAKPYFLKKVRVGHFELGSIEPGNKIDFKKKMLTISMAEVNKALSSLKNPEKKENTVNYSEVIFVLKADELEIDSTHFPLQDLSAKFSDVVFNQIDILDFKVRLK